MAINETSRQIAGLTAKIETLTALVAYLCTTTMPKDALEALVAELRTPVDSVSVGGTEDELRLARDLADDARANLAGWIDRSRNRS